MSSHRQLPYGLHAAPRRRLTRNQQWYLLGIAVLAFWVAVIALLVLW